MPSPRRRAKALRGELSEAEITELLAGAPAPGAPSVFTNPSEFLAARALLREQAPTWSPLARWLHEGPALNVRFKIHMAGDHPPLDPEQPALVDTSACPFCPPRGDFYDA
jgi:hypothetical protein